MSTIIDYDKVCVLKKGKITEFDHPYLLLVKNPLDTQFTKENDFTSLIQETGDENATMLFNLAKKYYQ